MVHALEPGAPQRLGRTIVRHVNIIDKFHLKGRSHSVYGGYRSDYIM